MILLWAIIKNDHSHEHYTMQSNSKLGDDAWDKIKWVVLK